MTSHFRAISVHVTRRGRKPLILKTVKLSEIYFTWESRTKITKQCFQDSHEIV